MYLRLTCGADPRTHRQCGVERPLRLWDRRPRCADQCQLRPSQPVELQEAPDHDKPDQEAPDHDNPFHVLVDHEAPDQDAPDHDSPLHEAPDHERPLQESPLHDAPVHVELFHAPPDHEAPDQERPLHDAPSHSTPKMSCSPVNTVPSMATCIVPREASSEPRPVAGSWRCTELFGVLARSAAPRLINPAP